MDRTGNKPLQDWGTEDDISHMVFNGRIRLENSLLDRSTMRDAAMIRLISTTLY